MATLDMQEEDLLEDVMLVAENDGDAYRAGKDAPRAVMKAFHAVKSTRLRSATEDFKTVKPLVEKYLEASWKGKKRPSLPKIDPDEERLFDMILNMASNDGDAYRDNKNAKRAVATAWSDYQRNVQELLREDFDTVKPVAIRDLQKRWRSNNPRVGKTNPMVLTTKELSKKVGPFRVEAVSTAPDKWFWRMFLGDEYLDGGPEAIGVDEYPTAEAALDMGEYLVRRTNDWEVIQKGAKQFRAFDYQDPKTDTYVAWEPDAEFSKVSKVVMLADGESVQFYTRINADTWKFEEIDDVGVEDLGLLSPRLTVGYARQQLLLRGPDHESVIQDSEIRGWMKKYMAAKGPDPKAVADALKIINQHRRKIAMAPLDPKSSGWTDEDVILEARRIQKTSNPQLQRERKSAVRARVANPDTASNGRQGPGRHGRTRR
jgi:hypothetical protein